MNKKDAYRLGKDRAEEFVLHNSLDDIVQAAEQDGDAFDIRDWSTVRDAAMNVLHRAEENARQFSPFEELASQFNASHDPDGIWDAFDAGIACQFRKSLPGLRSAWEAKLRRLIGEGL